MPHTSSVLPLAAFHHHHHPAHRSAPSLPFSATTDLFNLFAPSAMNYGDESSQYDDRSDQPRQSYGRQHQQQHQQQQHQQSQPIVQPLYAAQSSNGASPTRTRPTSDDVVRNGARLLTLAPILNPDSSASSRNSWDESGRTYPDWNPQTSPSYQLQGSQPRMLPYMGTPQPQGGEYHSSSLNPAQPNLEEFSPIAPAYPYSYDHTTQDPRYPPSASSLSPYPPSASVPNQSPGLQQSQANSHPFQPSGSPSQFPQLPPPPVVADPAISRTLPPLGSLGVGFTGSEETTAYGTSSSNPDARWQPQQSPFPGNSGAESWPNNARAPRPPGTDSRGMPTSPTYGGQSRPRTRDYNSAPSDSGFPSSPEAGASHSTASSSSSANAGPVSNPPPNPYFDTTPTASVTSVSEAPTTIKPKRRRADPNQLRVLNSTYERTAFPSTEERAELGRKLGMSPRQVQIWFQNKRQSSRQTRGNSMSSPSVPSSAINTSSRNEGTNGGYRPHSSSTSAISYSTRGPSMDPTIISLDSAPRPGSSPRSQTSEVAHSASATRIRSSGPTRGSFDGTPTKYGGDNSRRFRP